MTKCHNLNSVGTLEDDFSETNNLGRIAKALNNPNKITLEALGTEENRKEKLFNHFQQFFDIDPELQNNNPTLDHFMSGIDPLLLNKVSHVDNDKLIAPVTSLELKNIAISLKKISQFLST